MGAPGVRPVHDDAGGGRGVRLAELPRRLHRGGRPQRGLRRRLGGRRVSEPGEGARAHLRVRRVVRAGVQDGHGPRQGSIRHQSLRRRRDAHRRRRHRPPRGVAPAVPRGVLRRLLPPWDRRRRPAMHAEHIDALRRVPGRRVGHLIRSVHPLRGDTPRVRRGDKICRVGRRRGNGFVVRGRAGRGSQRVVRHRGGVRGVGDVAHAARGGVSGVGSIPRRRARRRREEQAGGEEERRRGRRGGWGR
mmetsp:Transcript_3229/g.14452  ORF Transcript_3229/g.14452 Transcript_3229/m.14452 type:complete len:246 (+) Transcript_3229:31-768(+)